jgi:hypothetical protein
VSPEMREVLERIAMHCESIATDLRSLSRAEVPVVVTHDGSERGVVYPIPAACDDDPPSRAVA